MLAARTRSAALAPLAALSFLTVIPIGRRFTFSEDDLRRSTPLFPVVGGGLGALAGLSALALADVLPATLAAAIAVALIALLTGCTHLDGLADTADALGGRSREQALTIMRDHTIGSFGAVVLITTLIVKVAALAALTAADDALPALAAAAACARFTPIALAAALPYARPGEGQGRTLAGRTSPLKASLAAAAALAIAAAAARTDGLILFAAACLLAVTLALCFHRWLAGVTGDTLGAATEITETLVLVIAAGLMV